MQEYIIQILKETIEQRNKLLNDAVLLGNIENIAQLLIQTFRQHNKVLFCGNGGSAADAQHLAAEFSNKFMKDRKSLDAEALHVNTSYLTAVANDYSYRDVYARLIEARGQEKDVLIALSTSGNSENIVEAVKMARQKNMIVVGWTGQNLGNMDKYCDILIKVPSDNTARIQEMHITIGHIICQLVEAELF